MKKFLGGILVTTAFFMWTSYAFTEVLKVGQDKKTGDEITKE